MKMSYAHYTRCQPYLLNALPIHASEMPSDACRSAFSRTRSEIDMVESARYAELRGEMKVARL